MSKQLLRHWQSQSLSALKQGSTLSIRSNVKNTNLYIQSKWRDDGFVSLLQTTKPSESHAHLSVSQSRDRITSLGREEPNILVEIKSSTEEPSDAKAIDSKIREFLKDYSIHTNNQSVVVLDDGRVEPDAEKWTSTDDEWTRVPYLDGVTLISPLVAGSENGSTSLALEVPEKVNLDCDLQHGGSITIHNKIEGDVRIRTADGDVCVQKLRGHILDIEALGQDNNIYSEDLLEAETLHVSLPQAGRFRAKRVHASALDASIRREYDTSALSDSSVLFDSDDAGALCDIGSLYITGDASVDVQSTDSTKQAVNIKSNHGHVLVRASQPLPTTTNPMTHEKLPIVEMSGVNASCEVYVSSNSTVQDDNKNAGVTCRVHFDSIAPDSVTVLHATRGDVSVTVDRKVETDLRMLSSPNASSVDIDTLLLDDDDDEYPDMVTTLEGMEPHESLEDPIVIKTKAFTEKPVERFNGISYMDGWMENKSSEPDSRFDRKNRGDVGSVGKIRLDGAAHQALQGFHGSDGKENSTFIRPMVLVVGTGKIMVETLSWLGNIARRYGLDDKREKDDLGRTATRRGRSLEPLDQ
eukprot:Nitzschia sp. Nitz4//scaffold4_size323378//198854//200596//NITZ4_000674-RA/size323378-processed-gene-0.363-mRNA-1//-1//CDS//3329553441//6253//frame0